MLPKSEAQAVPCNDCLISAASFEVKRHRTTSEFRVACASIPAPYLPEIYWGVQFVTIFHGVPARGEEGQNHGMPAMIENEMKRHTS